jgi:hypothetical protein
LNRLGPLHDRKTSLSPSIAVLPESDFIHWLLAEATIPWPDVQGFSTVDILNPAAQSGTQITYILYTKSGDFNLNDLQWDNLKGLVKEISRHTGRPIGEVAPERAAAQIEVKAGERRMFSFQRTFGWIIVGICAALLLLVMLGGLLTRFSVDAAKAAIFLVCAMVLGASLIRFYRRR